MAYSCKVKTLEYTLQKRTCQKSHALSRVGPSHSLEITSFKNQQFQPCLCLSFQQATR